MIDRAHLYSSHTDFFALGGSVVMRLSPEAAKHVCLNAATNGLVVARIEGGFWLNPGFESRLDCIWDGADPPLSQTAAHSNNLQAAAFIEAKAPEHSVFILTAPPISGWPHKKLGGAF
jgi:hypothetical protein